MNAVSEPKCLGLILLRGIPSSTNYLDLGYASFFSLLSLFSSLFLGVNLTLKLVLSIFKAYEYKNNELEQILKMYL